MTADETVESLYADIQRLKSVLLRWQHTSRLSKQEMRELRIDSREVLAKSSSQTVIQYLSGKEDECK